MENAFYFISYINKHFGIFATLLIVINLLFLFAGARFAYRKLASMVDAVTYKKEGQESFHITISRHDKELIDHASQIERLKERADKTEDRCDRRHFWDGKIERRK